MRIYTVHLRRHGLDPERDVVLVKEGFCWPGFFLSILWALWHRLWLVALALLLVEIAVSAGAIMLGLDSLSQTAVSVGVAVVIGYVANDLRRWSLSRQGFSEVAVVGAPDPVAASQRFHDLNPQLEANGVP